MISNKDINESGFIFYNRIYDTSKNKGNAINNMNIPFIKLTKISIVPKSIQNKWVHNLPRLFNNSHTINKVSEYTLNLKESQTLHALILASNLLVF